MNRNGLKRPTLLPRKEKQEAKTVLSWVSANREYRAVLMPADQGGNIVIQTKIGEGWMLLAVPMPASWEQSLVVVAMRLVEERAKITTPALVQTKE